MTTTTPESREVLAARVRTAGVAWRKAATAEQKRRAERDDLIRQAAAADLGVREIARLTSLDPTQVSRVLARGGDTDVDRQAEAGLREGSGR